MKRRHNKQQEGFVLLFVMVLLVIMLSVGLVTLREAGDRMKEMQAMRSESQISSAMSHGLDQAIEQIRQTDPADLAAMPAADLFAGDAPWIAGIGFPAAAATPQVIVDVGFRIGQKTRPPPGEDVRNAYGYVAEVQLAVNNDNAGMLLANAEQRVVVGIQVPHIRSHSGN